MDASVAVVVILFAVVACPVVYGLGLAWSRGYHRGKREYVARLVKENCEKER